MSRSVANSWPVKSALSLGMLVFGTLGGVAAAEPPMPRPAPPDVIYTRPMAVTQPVTGAQPMIMMLAAPGAENAQPPQAGGQPGAFGVAAEAPAGDVPPPPLGPGGIIRAPVLQRFVPQGAMQIVTPAGVMETGKFWLGMMCTPAPEVLRAQMALPAGTGLVVQEIVPDGPAAKAGLQRYDILLQADGQQLPDAAALGKVANDKGAVAVEFNLLRAGKAQTIKVTPAERPAQPFNVFIPQGDDRQAVDQWIEHLRQMAANRPEAVPGRALRLRILHPARVAGVEPQRPFPADLNIKVTREGNGPTKIEVKQGEKSWQVTSDEIGKLPETIRPLVEGMLGNLAGGGRAGVHAGTVDAFPIPEVEFQPGIAVGGVQAVPTTPPATAAPLPPPAPMPPPAGAQKDRSADLDQLRDQLKELQRRLDHLDTEKPAK